MKKILLNLLIYNLSFLSLKAQENNYWTSNESSKGKIATEKAVARIAYPKEFKLYSLDINPLREQLFSIVGKTAKGNSTIITLPNSEGQLEEFEVFEASNFDNELQARFPEIRAYSGKGITDKYATLKLSIAPNGIQTMVFRADEKPAEFIEPYSQDHTIYSVYKSQRDKSKLKWTCFTPEEKHMVHKLNNSVKNIQRAASGELKVMRLAQSCNGEYANYFGATTAGTTADKALVLTAFNNTLTRCNGVYEKDLALHLNLINETTNVIYCNPATDPYSTTLSQWNTQLQIALNNNIGTSLANSNSLYDIGHMFGKTGGGGNAGCIGCPCVDGISSGAGQTKGRGITSPADGIPQGDNFDIDYVVHEIGHQLGGNHTFSNSDEGTGVNLEVGSGITIMGYAGITNADYTNHSIDKYHAATIDQIQNNLTNLSSCGVTTNISSRNATPTVTIVNGSITIPISTPFALDCTGTDANPNDVLTYSWEQMDLPFTFTDAYSNATVSKTDGPNFTSYQASSSSLRYFPRMASSINNSLITGFLASPCTACNTGFQAEAIPNNARTMNFRVTVRDNAPYVSTVGSEKVGQTSFTDMTVTTNATGGAFTVSSQATTGTTYTGGSTQTVTWNAGSTANSPFNATNVDILISYDSGLTWTSILAATPNDGTQTVTMPNPATNQTNCRIMVRSAVTATQKSFFFDLNNVAFTLNNNPLSNSDFSIVDLNIFPNPNNGNFKIEFAPQSSNVNVSIHDMRGRKISQKEYSNNGLFNEEISINNAQKGIYLVSVQDGNRKEVKKIVVE